MAKTPISATSPYCTPAQFLNFFDARTVGDLVNDVGQRVPASQLLTDPVLGQLLQEASGEVEAACLMGDRYTVADLQALNGNSALFLASIVAGLTYFKLIERRPDLDFEIPPMAQRADKFLRALSMGERIFAFQETADAGIVEDDYNSPALYDQTRGTSFECRRFFGRRVKRIPIRPINYGAGGS